MSEGVLSFTKYDGSSDDVVTSTIHQFPEVSQAGESSSCSVSCIANPLHPASAIGTAAGITAGGTVVVAGMMRGARAGSAFGIVGSTVGAVAGGILNLLWGVTSGGLLGAQAGKLIDENVIGLYRCSKCHLQFKA